ncbi:DUF5131 family protein [Nocardia transvalensis]|uniref:DUF5131 family protein n=1 Tax=Nocardia transvalensis TaxID=37333 RepID=UPI001895B5CD|nr:DUF5131 family protein [Nocardia transvalensis]MBF6333567.1 DUF5131 family protein [Nocardia transvalensis]
MAAITHIGWTFSDDGRPGSTLNLGSGCTRVSAGCLNCYIERTAPLRIAHRRFDGPGIGASLPIVQHPERLAQPLRWRKPRRIFLNSLTDTFHDAYPDSYIARAWAVMATARWHTFQIPTKRPARMRALMTSAEFRELVDDEWATLPRTLNRPTLIQDAADRPSTRWPLDNVWLGVSTEDQHTVELRIPQLVRTPAVVRFVSAEPLLTQIDLRRFLGTGPAGLDWVIVGGESGPITRITRMDPQWTRDLIEQCRTTATACFFKQTGTLLAHEWGITPPGDNPREWPEPFPQQFPIPQTTGTEPHSVDGRAQ